MVDFFSPAATLRVANTRPRVFGYTLPAIPPHHRGPRYPRPFKVRDETEFSDLFGRLTGRDAFDAKFTYNLFAWLQNLHSTLADAKSEQERGRIPSRRFARVAAQTRVGLHLLFLMTTTRNGFFKKYWTDGSHAAAIQSVVLNDDDSQAVYDPMNAFFADTSHSVQQYTVARNHGIAAGSLNRGPRADLYAPPGHHVLPPAGGGRGGRGIPALRRPARGRGANRVRGASAAAAAAAGAAAGAAGGAAAPAAGAAPASQ